MIYLILKTLHVVGAAVLLGTGAGIAFFAWFGYRLSRREDSIELLRGILSLTVTADWVFTATAAVLQPVTGAALWWMTFNNWTHPWLLLVIGLYIGVGVCWLPVVALQIRLRDAARAVSSISELDAGFHRQFKVWFALGIPSFLMMLALFAVMVMRGFFF